MHACSIVYMLLQVLAVTEMLYKARVAKLQGEKLVLDRVVEKLDYQAQ
jgi:hypothetical protein